MTDRLQTRADFENFQQAARQRWDALWQGEQLIVSVGVDSSSEPKGALRVLAACREALRGTNAIVREVSGNGAMWMEPTVEIKRPGEPPVVYGWIAPADVPALLAGDLQDSRLRHQRHAAVGQGEGEERLGAIEHLQRRLRPPGLRVGGTGEEMQVAIESDALDQRHVRGKPVGRSPVTHR